VLDLDVRAFFDSVPHSLLLKAVAHHTSERWVLLYISRWLVAPMVMPVTTRNNLANWLGKAGQVQEATGQYQRLLADRTRVLGPDHPDTLLTRNNLAHWLGKAGQVQEATGQFG
jgi:hypothetical protein